MILSLRSFGAPATAQDEGIFVVYPELILEGSLPNEDFEAVYGPASYYVLVPFFAAFEPSYTIERIVGALYRLALALGVFSLLRTKRFNATAAAIVVAAISFLEGSSAYPWWAAIACGAWAFTFADRVLSDSPPARTAVPAVAAGSLLALAISFRVDLAPASILCTLLLMTAMPREPRVRFAVGFATGLLPLIVHAALVGPARFIDGLVVDPLAISPGRRLPLTIEEIGNALGLTLLICAIALAMWHRAHKRLVVSLSLFMLLSLTHYLQRAEHMHFFFAGALPLGLLVGVALNNARRHVGTAITLLFVLVLMMPLYLWRMDAQDLVGPVLVPLSIGFGTLVGVEVGRSLPFQRKLYAGVVIGAATVWTMGVFSTVTDDSQRSFLAAEDAALVSHAGRTYPLAVTQTADAARALLRDFGDVAPGTRLFVGPRDLSRTNYNDTFLYHLIPQAEPATYYLEMNPGSANNDPDLADQLATADLVILTADYDDWSEDNESAEPGNEGPNAVLLRDFCITADYDPYWVYIRRNSGASCDE